MLNFNNTTKQSPFLKEADFVAIKNSILGKKYTLSLNFIGESLAKKLNKEYRNKTYTPNILSFPLDDKEGEIFICSKTIPKESKEFEMTPKQYETFLFIHGCLHLKGLDHGQEMEKLEDKFLKKFIK